ncbi:class I SAM-dependent methyltransferase [soil metagenome]
MSYPPDASVSFDRASDYYDRTRALSEDAMSAILRLLSAELAGKQPCLEIGVGTGRIALPLAAEGVALSGVDLSLPMLTKLVEKSDGAPPFPIAGADATLLPFPDGAFGAGLACHVLHLIPRWHAAVGEMARVVRPGGVVLVDVGGWGSGWVQTVHERFAASAGLPSRRAGAEDASEVDEAMRALGAGIRELAPVKDVRRLSVGSAIDDLEAGLYSNTWSASPDVRRRAAGATRCWAQEELGDLDEVRDETRVIAWRAYDLT